MKTFLPHALTGSRFDHLLALLCLGGMIALELATQTTISPLVSMACFGLFAHRMRPALVAGWVAIFCFTSLLFLLAPWQADANPDLATAYIRFATLCLGGIGAFALSVDRSRIAEGSAQPVLILEKLPAPVIISDAGGGIVFMNTYALQLLDTTLDAVRGASYFSFVAGEEKGKTVQNYLDFVDSDQSVLSDMILQLKKPSHMKVQATLVAIEGKHSKLVATVL